MYLENENDIHIKKIITLPIISNTNFKECLMLNRFLARLIVNLFCVMIIPTMVFAFQQEAKVKGKVIDPSGNPITEANLTLLTAKGTQVAQATPNSDGTFELSGVLTGNYV
jgi:hypothetical protein